MEHLLEYTRSEKGKKLVKSAIKKDTKRQLDKLKTKSMWLKEAQAVFNKYIRLRDFDDPCICCDRHHPGQYHAGHYLSVGARPHLRFDERNVHKQASYCNNHKSGNQAEYRKRLIRKIGEESVLALESDNEPKRYTIDDIKLIIAEYKGKVADLERKLQEQGKKP